MPITCDLERAMKIIVIGNNTAGIRSINFTRKRQVSFPPIHHLRYQNKKKKKFPIFWFYLYLFVILTKSIANFEHLTNLSRPVSLLMANRQEGQGPPLKKSSSLYWSKLFALLILSESKSTPSSQSDYSTYSISS